MSVELPEAFEASMKSLLGGEYGEYVESLKGPEVCGLRANPLKWTPGQCALKVGGALAPVPWEENGFYYHGENRLAKHPYYFAGLYYLQEPSAMAPAAILPVEPGDRVLDLCAAPGGKSTQLGARLRGKGFLLANDVSNSRAKALLKNLELFGVSNVCVTSETPQRLMAAYPEYFDKILVDAPCSGEGMFRKNPGMIKDWMEKGPQAYAPLQKEILGQALAMLRPGGVLVYSTCTFSRTENEEVVLEALARHKDVELVPIPPFEGAWNGIGLPGCIRLFPHRIRGEGHFIAMLRKAGGRAADRQEGAFAPWRQQAVDFGKEPELKAFLDKIKGSYNPERFFASQGLVSYLPEDVAPAPGLRYLRTGLFMGSLKKGRFEPGQALAMTLDASTFSDSLSFSSGDDRMVRYLKGETISLEETQGQRRGWQLVCVEGFGLGFGKGMGKSLKNKYYPGWRWM